MNMTQSVASIVTLANASEFVNAIAQAVVGNDVADTIEGTSLTNEAVRDLALSQFQMTLGAKRGGL